MKKNIFVLSAALGLALAITGCSSLQTASVEDFNGQKVVTSGTPVKHMSVTTTGLYFLWFPLITGSVQTAGTPAFLEDTVNTNALTTWITSAAKAEKATKVVNLTSSKSSFGLLFSMKQAHVSATAIK